MNFLVNCDCGHTLEHHVPDGGCRRCACTFDRVAALDALIEALRAESAAVVPRAVRSRRTTSSGTVLRACTD